MNQEFVEALAQLERERGISKEVLIEAVEAALVSALKRDQHSAQNIRVQLNPETGEIKVFNRLTVAEEIVDDREEINLAEAKAIDPRYEIGDVVEEEIMPKEFGRIAAQTAKQVVVQRIREAERSLIYEEFANRVGDIVTGIVQRYEQRNVYIDLGKIEGVLSPIEQMPGERYEQGMRLKVYILEVKRTTKGPQVVVSRARPGLLKRLFELEVPEIQEGLVEIKAVAREPGARSKIAVYSREPHVDPVGACVGARGNRVQMIVRELKGEKIDIIPWNPDWEMFIAKAMSPARVAAVQLAPSRKTALVVVPDHQLSLAIGREGQNARLAAKMTGWKIDIRSESQIAEMSEDELEAIIPLEEGDIEVPMDLPDGEPVSVAAEAEQPVTETDLSEEEAPAPAVEPIDEEEERAKESPKRKSRKNRTKQRDLELELEAMDDTGIEFFSDVLSERQGDKKDEGDSAAAEAPAPLIADTAAESVEELSPLAQALQRAVGEKTPAGKKPAVKKSTATKSKAGTKPAGKAAAKPGRKATGTKTAAKTKGDAAADTTAGRSAKSGKTESAKAVSGTTVRKSRTAKKADGDE